MKKRVTIALVMGMTASAAIFAGQPMMEETGQAVAADVIRVALRAFEWRDSGQAPLDITRIVVDDLRRSGLIAPILTRAPVDSDPKFGEESLEFDKWRLQGVRYLVTGQFFREGDGERGEKFAVRLRVYEVKNEEKQEDLILQGDGKALRALAHSVSNTVFSALTGERGVYNTRIAYVAKGRDKKGGHRYALEIADADGENPHAIVVSGEPLRAAAWSPDAEYVSYITLEAGQPRVYRQRLTTGARELLAEIPRINSTPLWSPAGDQLIFSTAGGGKSCIYLLDVRTKGLRCVVNRSMPVSDPAWAPDGLSVIYTVLIDGIPRIRRFIFSSGDDIAPSTDAMSGVQAVFAPDGWRVAYVRRTGKGQDQLLIRHLKSNSESILHTAARIGKPSFAPNGRQLMYAVNDGAPGRAHDALYVASTDGRFKSKLTAHGQERYDPAWAPWAGPASR